MADKGRGPDFSRIEERDLRDDGRLRDLYTQAVRRRYWANNNAAALEFAALAEKALQDDGFGTPGRLFYALVKRKDSSMISEAAEVRAMKRFPSHVREDMVDAAAFRTARNVSKAIAEKIEEVLEDHRIGYSHAVMVQCFLPHRATRERRWRTSHGRASLSVEAGSLANPGRPGEWIDCDVPSGPKPRLIVPYIVGEAIRNGHPEVDLGSSLRNFMSRLGVPVTGNNGKALTREIQNIAAAEVVIGEWTDDAVHTRGGRIAKRISFWLERDPEQLSFWTPSMCLSDDFFRAIQEHRVPVDMGHLARLARSPRRMDLYAWLSYRTPRIRARSRQPVPLDGLWAVFGTEIANFRHFKSRLRSDLAAIAEVYAGFNAEIDGDILWLRRSSPPVPFATRLALPAA